MNHRPRRTRRSRKTLAVAVVAALAVGIGAWYFSQRDAGADAGTWRTVEVEQGDIRVAISATGTLSAISTVVVGSQISGQVTDVLVDFNDKVVQGQVLARIERICPIVEKRFRMLDEVLASTTLPEGIRVERHVVMGPGAIEQAHQPNEFIEQSQIAPAVKIIEGLINTFCV